MAHLIGIDLGSYSVKVTVYEGGFGRYQLHSVFNQRLSEGSQPLVARQSEALSRILSGLHIQNPSFVASFSAQNATSRFIPLPFGDPAKVEQVLPFQVEGVVPFDISEMVMTHRIVDLRDSETDAMACLASREKVQSTLSDLETIGIDPSVLPVDADALTHFSKNGVEAIVDIGHSRCLCALSIEGKGSAFRQVNRGMSTLSHALAEAQSIGVTEAEEIMWMTDLAVRAASVEEIDFSPLYSSRDLLIQDIQRTLILFEDSTNVEIERVRICGGGAGQKGMIPLLEKALGVPVETISLSKQIEQQLTSASAHALSVALAEIATGNSPIRVLDLRKEELAFRGHLANLGRVLKFGSIAAVAGIILGLGWFGYRYVQLSNQISNIDDDIVSQVQEAMPEIDPELLDDANTAYAFLQSEVIDSTEKMNKLGSIVAEEPPVLGLLKAIAENLPPHKEARVDVSELNITENAIIIKAETDGFEDAAEMEAALQRYPKFRGTKKSNEEKGRRNQGIQFTITIPLETEEEKEEI